MYTDLYLKFTSESEANSVLFTVHPATLDEDGVTVAEEYSTPNYANIDIIGTLYEPMEPMVDPEATPVAPVALDGYHVNVRVVTGEDSGPLLPFSIVPTVPRRVWG